MTLAGMIEYKANQFRQKARQRIIKYRKFAVECFRQKEYAMYEKYNKRADKLERFCSMLVLEE